MIGALATALAELVACCEHDVVPRIPSFLEKLKQEFNNCGGEPRIFANAWPTRTARRPRAIQNREYRRILVNLRSGASNPSNDVGLDCPQSETFEIARARRRTCSAVPPVATLDQIDILTIDMPSSNRVGMLPESFETSPRRWAGRRICSPVPPVAPRSGVAHCSAPAHRAAVTRDCGAQDRQAEFYKSRLCEFDRHR